MAFFLRKILNCHFQEEEELIEKIIFLSKMYISDNTYLNLIGVVSLGPNT